MAKQKNPGARSGATGVEKAVHAEAESTISIAFDARLAKEAATLLAKLNNRDASRSHVISTFSGVAK